ncbi:MAG: hypothetical protein D6797_02020, partial [Bdellovibrio sp.]
LKVARNTLPSKKITVVFEWIPQELLPELQLYLKGASSLKHFLSLLKEKNFWNFNLSLYGRLLSFCKKNHIKILLPEHKNSGDLPLKERDSLISKILIQKKKDSPQNKFFVFYGAYHLLGPEHLGDLIQQKGFATTVFTGFFDKAFWRAYKEAPLFQMVQLEENIFYWLSDTPLERNQKILEDWKATGPSWEEAKKQFEEEESFFL